MALLLNLYLANTGLKPNRKWDNNLISPRVHFHHFHFCTGHGVHLSVYSFTAKLSRNKWLFRSGSWPPEPSWGHQCRLQGQTEHIHVHVNPKIMKALALHQPMWVPSEAWTRLLWLTSLWNHCVLTNGKGKHEWGEEIRKGGCLWWCSLSCPLREEERREVNMKIKEKITKELVLEPLSCLHSPFHWYMVGQGQERLERHFSTSIL